MEHYYETCSGNHLFFSSQGLQCGNCLSIDFFDRLSEKQKNDYIKDIEKMHNIKLDPKTGRQIKSDKIDIV